MAFRPIVTSGNPSELKGCPRMLRQPNEVKCPPFETLDPYSKVPSKLYGLHVARELHKVANRIHRCFRWL